MRTVVVLGFPGSWRRGQKNKKKIEGLEHGRPKQTPRGNDKRPRLSNNVKDKEATVACRAEPR
jgi:hypothetical protein